MKEEEIGGGGGIGGGRRRMRKWGERGRGSRGRRWRIK